MKQRIYVIVDISGSMNEMGKFHLQRNLCRYTAQLPAINQEKYADLDICLYQWSEKISEINLQSNGDIPAFKAEGFSNLFILSDFLSQHLNVTGRAKVLILTDGHFNRDDFKSFLKWKKQQKLLLIRAVAVGADADLLKLMKISTNNTVFLSENVASAIDSTIFGSDEPLTAPISTARILESAPAETEEPEEDWDA